MPFTHKKTEDKKPETVIDRAHTLGKQVEERLAKPSDLGKDDQASQKPTVQDEVRKDLRVESK